MQWKRKLANKKAYMLAEIHGRREELSRKPEYIKEVLEFGASRARKEAEKVMAEVKEAMNVL